MKYIISIWIITLLLASGFIIYSYDRNEESVKILNEDDYKDETNYISLVHLGQAPNSIPREPNEGDIDTGVTGVVDGVPVRMYSSRTWANNDYGKTFLWRDD